MKKRFILYVAATLIAVMCAAMLAGCSQARDIPEEKTLADVLEKGG